MKKLIYLSLIAVISACETTITPELDTAEEIMVVDAWIIQKMERQEIRITRSQPYFDNSVPAKISGASVVVEDLNTGITYEFQEGSTSYYWDPMDAPFGVTGHNYRLTVSSEGETFEAYSKLGRVPPVESIKFKYNQEDYLIKEAYYTAEFMVTDPLGVGDAYWIKAWRNGIFLGKPEEINIAFDGGFSAGQSVDGHPFISPIRRDYINPLDKKKEKENEFIPPYLVGDSLHIEIHSLDPAAFDFLFGVFFHTNRPGGFGELFSYPLANASTNLLSTDEHSTTNMAGFFNVASVSSGGKKLTQEIADLAKQEGD